MLAVVVLVAVLLVWALVARRLASLSITTAIAVVVAGMVLTAGSHPVIRVNLETTVVERGVEVVLAILLFIDATAVPGGILGRERRVIFRLLGIALPLSLALAWLVGFALFPHRDFWLLGLLAIIVVPVDLAPAVAIVRDRRVPARLREIVNIEAGLNDGVAAPLFLFCLAGATAKRGTPAIAAPANAVPAILVAIGSGRLSESSAPARSAGHGSDDGPSRRPCASGCWPSRSSRTHWRSFWTATASSPRSSRGCFSPSATTACHPRPCSWARTWARCSHWLCGSSSGVRLIRCSMPA